MKAFVSKKPNLAQLVEAYQAAYAKALPEDFYSEQNMDDDKAIRAGVKAVKALVLGQNRREE